MPILSEKQRALLIALRRIEEAETPVDISALALETGYSDASIRTYFTKKLEGVLVFRNEDGWRVQGALRCAERVFGRHMTQKAGSSADAVKTEEAWQMAMRKLLYEGMRRGYSLSAEEEAILAHLNGEPPLKRWPSKQPGLFED